MVIFGDDEQPRLPSAQPFPAGDSWTADQADVPVPVIDPTTQEDANTDAAEAAQRRVRAAKQLKIDDRAEISNKELYEWNNSYLENMRNLLRIKEQSRSAVQARKNAAFWILGQGIGGVETCFGEEKKSHPLAMFSGQALLDILTGRASSPAGSKRSRSLSPGQADSRRVRARTEEDEDLGRGVATEGEIGMRFDDDGMIVQDEYHMDSEVGRRAGSSIPDMSSVLPWNRSVSRQGSAQHFGSGGLAISSSVGGVAGGMQVGPPSAISGRRSRLHSASPLMGKGHSRLPSLGLEDVHPPRSAGLGDDEVYDEYELYGPAAAVDTQTAGQSQWMRATLENEAQNFLLFLETQVHERAEASKDSGSEERVTSITLDELLAPADNTAVVGAQALLHVLSLATKGLIRVEQKEAFEEIRLTIPIGEDGRDLEQEGDREDYYEL